jgi:hypothetical protein
MDGEHLAPWDTKYIGAPNQGDLREERLQINIYITLINDVNEINYSLLKMIVAPRYVVLGWHTMYLAGAILNTCNHMLINIGMMHNLVHINFMHILDLLEHHINTTFIVGSGNEALRRTMAFAALLRINAGIFDINTHHLDSGNVNNYINTCSTILMWLVPQCEDALIGEGGVVPYDR